MKILLRNCNIQDTISAYEGNMDLLIEDKKITKIAKNIEEEPDRIIDVKGLTVIPGLIDLHCHLREPGFEYKETIKSGSEAAAKGGYTVICCMPNTNPVIDNTQVLLKLKDIIERDSLIKVIPIGAVTLGQKGEETVDFQDLVNHGVNLFSDDGYPIWNNFIMLKSLEESRDKNFLIIDHCEDLGLVDGGVINQGEVSKQLGLKGISGLSEELLVLRDVVLAEEVDAKIHIAHISTAKSLEIIKKAKSKGIAVSCEVTPHHISLSDEDIINNDTNYKVNPPLRTREDVKRLQDGLEEGIIDIIATDHAPHGEIDKPEDFYYAANGISNIEIAFAISYTYLVRSGKLSLKELLEKMSLNPAKILDINQGSIEINKEANIAIVDLDKKYKVHRNEFISKGKNTPFHGKELYGEVLMTIADGNIVYEKEGEF